MGAKVTLVTPKADNLGELSCNPSIGGVAKGVIVREIDAFDGIMGRVADQACIHERMLNTGKGPAVQALRAQMDRSLYKQAMQRIFRDEYSDIEIIYDMVNDIIIDNGVVVGVVLSQDVFVHAKTVIITTGTFLNGKIYMGDEVADAGRINESASNKLSNSLLSHGLTLGRLKTGTPARIYKDSIDYSVLNAQFPDQDRRFFSELSEHSDVPQVNCHITYTNKHTHNIIRDNLHQSAIFNGTLSSKGPRYCPSIEDKIT